MTLTIDQRLRINVALDGHFPKNPVAISHFGDLLSEYRGSGIAAPHLIEEIETGDEGKLWSCVWEAMLYRHLHALGYDLRGTSSARGQNGPDFCLNYGGRRIWIEAVAPAPTGMPAEFLQPAAAQEEVVSRRKPDIERVLRCTSAIGDKLKKLATYKAGGLIGANDCAVIAINICRLSDIDPDGNGISQYPLSMEAVFPIGPLAVMMARDGTINGPATNIARVSVTKPSGREISTALFLDDDSSIVSAIIQCHQRHVYNTRLSLALIHNPLALNPIPQGQFAADKEYVSNFVDDMLEVHDICLERRVDCARDSLVRRYGAREDIVVPQLFQANGVTGKFSESKKNVDRWCVMQEHLSHRRVLGWLVSDDGILEKHVVVDVGRGELRDLTPPVDDRVRTFLAHDGEEDEFLAMPSQLVLVR